ncbi:fumarylacetoacetate hydrolase family protein [Aquibacillus saliphilus]|uniref:fumarylacetoacetate hydrolase family protein n=1 Tax=Aquibacillus saliphilus TaxID=1909422 RepID=UPI001CF03E96|nr:fumarylacetoacetate hydrolase family protein [Aquibacillus saliphilus]
MKLVSLNKDGKDVLGVKTANGMIDIGATLSKHPKKDVPLTIMEVIEGGSAAVTALEDYITELADSPSYILEESQVEYLPCVTNPGKIICIGLNYRKHADETKSPYPKTPILFSKFNNTLAGHQQDIPVPKVTKKVDYEVELGIVIGKETKNVSEQTALDHVFGYFTANDLSARDLQFTTHQWLLGKTCDYFNPIGPFLVTSDEVVNPQNLNLKTIVNDEVRQNSNTSDMIFSCSEIISYISQHMTLVPGDIIITGTPEGVIMGYPEDKQVFLLPGDKVTVEVENLGALTNTLITEE